MRRLIVLITAATLCGLAASAQEVSSASGNEFEVSAVARFDVNPYFPLKEGSGSDFTFGNTSIYTFIDGSFGNGWFYSFSNHWLGVDWYKTTGEGDTVTPLYSNTWHSDANDWIDWALLGYSLESDRSGTWEFSIGKDMMAIGLTELEDNDVDCHYDLSSWYWNNYAYAVGDFGGESTQGSFYQWGASAAWTSASESSSLKFQFASSPFSVHPFNDFRKSLSLLWTEEHGCWRGMLSANAMESYKRPEDIGSGAGTGSSWWKCLALGERFTFGNLSFCLDGMLRSLDWNSNENQALVTLKAQYDFGEKVSLFAKAGYEALSFSPKDGIDPETVAFGGIGVHFYPLRNSRALRIHAVAAASDGLYYAPDQLSLNIGVTYSLDFIKLFGK